MSSKLPSFGLLKHFYPSVNSVGSNQLAVQIGGNLEKGMKDGPGRYIENTCVVRISRALNQAGAPIEVSSKLKTVVRGKDRSKRYALRVAEFYEYMIEQYGKPDLVWDASTGQLPSLFFRGKKGIIIYSVIGWSDASGHVDLWNDSTCSTQCYPANSKSISLWLAH